MWLAAGVVARFLQHGFLFHPGSLHGIPRTERAVVGDDVLALHGRPRSDRIHLARKGHLYRARRDVGKNFRTGEAAQRVALERPLETFRPTEGESASCKGDGGW